MEVESGKTFKNILGTYSKLTIPSFQRSYTWKKKQIEYLWEGIVENKKGYYLGTLVCIQASASKKGFSLDIIDGQQRLITLSLFLIAIRDYLLTNKKPIRKYETLLYSKDPLKEREPRISFYKNNLNKIYLDLLENARSGRLDDAQKNIKRNYDIAYSMIVEYITNGGNSDDLRVKIEGMEFHLIRSADESEIYKLFEGLNATALSLTQVELLKNGILKYLSAKRAKKEHTEKALIVWESMESSFEKYNLNLFNKFLRYDWITREGYISGSMLYSSIRKKYLKNKEVKFVNQYLKKLKENSLVYISLRKADVKIFKEKNKGTRRALKYLEKISLLGVDQVYEVLLAAHTRYAKKRNFPLTNYSELLRFLSQFAFISKYSTLSPSQYERIFAFMAERINNSRKNNFFGAEIKPKLRELRSLISNREDEFIKRFIENCRYNNSRRIIFFVFEDIIEKDNRKTAIREPEIEHILPQKPKKWNLIQSQIRLHVHKIGNLTLLSNVENTEEARDETMKVKVKKVFLKSPFKINKELAKWESDFTSDFRTAIDARSEELAREVYNLYVSNWP